MKSLFTTKSIVYVSLFLFSLIAVIVNEGRESFLFVNHFYRAILTLGLFTVSATIYRSKIGRIVSILFLVLLTLNFSTALISRCIYNTSFDETQATNVLLTNSNEAGGMLKGYILYILISLIYFIVACFLLSKLSRIVKENRKIILVFNGLVILLFSVFIVECIATNGEVRWNKNSSFTKFLNKTPIFNIARLKEASNFIEESSTITETKVDYSNLKFEENNIKNIIVVVGESARKDALSLYGSKVETTPKIQNRKENLLIYENAVAPAPYTILAVPLMLSKLTPVPNYSVVEASDNIVRLANNVPQYKTYWYSTHEKAGQHVNAISSIASFAQKREWLEHDYDEALIRPLRATLKDNSSKRIIFLHIRGSHYPTSERYPKDFEVFNSDTKKYVNEYNNSIYYTDYVLDSIIKEIENTSSVLVYAPDHGQVANKTMFTHSLSKKGLEVPLFIWHSNSVEEKFKKNGIVDAPISTTEVYEIIKDYLGVSSSRRKPKNEKLEVLSGDMKVYEYQNLDIGDNF